MIDGSEKRNRQLAFELQNSHVCEKRSKFSRPFFWKASLYFFSPHKLARLFPLKKVKPSSDL